LGGKVKNRAMGARASIRNRRVSTATGAERTECPECQRLVAKLVLLVDLFRCETAPKTSQRSLDEGKKRMTSTEPTPTVLESPLKKTAPPTSEPHKSRKSGGKGGGRLILIVAACLILAVIIFAGIRSHEEAAQRESAAEESGAPSVSVVYPKPASTSDEITLPGSTQPFIDTPVFARTSGYLKSWRTDIGARVKKGELLAEIETPELDQQLKQAESDLKNAKANLEIAEVTNSRWQKMVKADTVSQQEADQTASSFHAMQASFEAAKANVRRLEQLQSFEKVVAPFDGVITARNTDIGALIQAGDSSTPRELFHIMGIRTLRIYISVPEVDASSVKIGEKVDVTLDSLPGEKFTGTLVRTAEAIDPTSRTLNTEVDVENPDGRLLPGAYATVGLKVPSSVGAVLIPTNTLLFRSEGLRVGVARNGHAELVPITIGRDFGNTVEVIAGLTTKDALISDPSDSLVNGAEVRVEEPAK
jgi:RND family efflux transporter MFP subunit